MTYEHKPYMSKSYKALLEDAVKDEASAGEVYRYMAMLSGNADEADLLRGIAADEDRHYGIVQDLLERARAIGPMGRGMSEHMKIMRESGFMPTPQQDVPGWEQRIQVDLGHRHPSQVTASQEEYEKPMPAMGSMRPMPVTPMDWEDLGYDIEAKLPDKTQQQSNEIRHYVAVATYNEPGNADDARRWLLTKANEVGLS